MVQRYEYDAWGNITAVQDPAFQQPYGFTGREYDPESGLYYYRARYYDPEVGRFLSEDPIGLAGGLNTYRYVGNDPVNWADPTGEGPIGLAMCVGLLAADTISTGYMIKKIGDKQKEILDEIDDLNKTCSDDETDIRKLKRIKELEKELGELTINEMATWTLGLGVGLGIGVICPGLIASPF